MIIGYARTSSDDRDRSSQHAALTAAGCDIVHDDEAGGATARRPGLKAALAACRPGDVLTVWKLDRLGRSAADLLRTLDGLVSRGVEVRVLTGRGAVIDTTRPEGRTALAAFGALAEFEEDVHDERTRESVAKARRRGARVGRPPRIDRQQLGLARRLAGEGKGKAEIAGKLGVDPATLRRYLNGHQVAGKPAAGARKTAPSGSRAREKDRLAARLSGELEGADAGRIVASALEAFSPVKVFVGFSGGNDSLVTTHWAMNHVPGCEVFHANTGIGIEAARQFVRDTCAAHGWPLTEIRAKEDCGQDYDEMVRQYGFPGPGVHTRMFQRLKERPTRELVRRHRTARGDHVAMLTGIRKDESFRRSGYTDKLLAFTGNTLWVSPFYYATQADFTRYIAEHGLKTNPVAAILGMSGECLCGSYAEAGEKERVRRACPAAFERIERLEALARASGHGWGWEDAPPIAPKRDGRELFMPFCAGCGKDRPREGSSPEGRGGEAAPGEA